MSDARENNLKRKSKSSTGDGMANKTSKKKKSDNLQQYDEDFPRGGSSTLTPLEVRNIKDEAEKDILFGTPSSEGTKTKKKNKKDKSSKQSESTDDDNYYIAEKAQTVENLTFKSLCEGDLLLGVVQEVFDFEFLVSLPNNLTGCVNITNINKSFTLQLEEATKQNEDDQEQETLFGLSNIFPVGMIVKCVVISTDSSKHGHSKIRLSVDPTDVNKLLTSVMIIPNMVMSGYVSSIEDHGYAVSLGIDGVSGFLPKNKTSDELCVGQLLNCLVSSINANKRLAQLECDKNKIKTVLTKQSDNIVFSSLLPGMLVKSTVKEVTTYGVTVAFLDGFTGTVSVLHLKQHGSDGEDLKKLYPIKSKILCRVLFVCPSRKTVGLSMLQHVVDYEPSSFSSYSIGDVVEEAVVTRLDQGKGLLLQLSDSVAAFAHVSRLSDKPLTKIEKKFKVGSTHRCRILNFNTLTGLALVTLQESIIDEPFIRYQDIHPGVIVSGTIQSLLKSGMLVSISDHIRGFCHALHYADVPLKHPEKKLSEGKKVKCRVLYVDPERKRLHLTHKKTLVNSELKPVIKYSDIQVGMKVQGFITSIREYGCIVHFYNKIHGLVRNVDMGLRASERPNEAFYIGQVVTCVVIFCNTSKQKLGLSFNLSATPLVKPLTLGTLVDVDVVAKSDSGLDVQIKPSNTPAFLPRPHLSDHLEHCRPLLEVLSPSTGENAQPKILNNVLYYGRNRDKSLVVSCKQSLIKFASEGNFVKRFEDVQVGMILPGSVRQTMPYGLFIEFSPNVYGLAPNSFLSDKYVADASQYFQINQSVFAKVIETHADRRRFLVSLKPSDCYRDQGNTVNTMVDLLQDYIQERDRIIENQRNSSDEWSFTSFTPGSIVSAKVTAVKNYGTTFNLEEGAEGFAPPQLTKGTNFVVGEVVDALVLDYDLEKKRVYLSVDSNTIRRIKEKKTTSKKKLKPGQVVSVIIQIIHREYAVVILPKHGFKVAFVPTKANLNDIRDPVSRFTVGQTCDATVKGYITGKLDHHNYLIVSVDNSQETINVIKPGDITTGVVRSIKNLQINVNLSGGKYHGRVHVTEISDDAAEGTNPLTLFKCGENVQVKVLGFRDSKNHNFLPITHRNFSKAVAELSTRESWLREDDNNNDDKKVIVRELADYKEGERILCFVKSVHASDIWMSVSTSVDGRVGLLEASTDIKVLDDLSSHFMIGVGYHCTVLDVDEEHKSLNLSLIDCDIKKGQVVYGRITKLLANRGLLLSLPRRKCGMVFLTDLMDKFQNDPLGHYKMKQLLRCYVLDVGKSGQIDLSTRPSKTKGETSKPENSDIDKEIQTLEDIEEGDVLRGYVKTITDVGLFVSLSRSISARVQIKNVSQFFVKNWKSLFYIGQLVKGKVLSIDPCNNRIELSLKGKDVKDHDPAPKPERREKPKLENSKRGHESSDSDGEDEGEVLLKKLRKGENNGDVDSSDVEMESENDDVSSESENEDMVDENKKPRLKVSAGFDWNTSKDNEGLLNKDDPATDSDNESDTSEVEENSQVTKKKSKRAKRAAKKAEEDLLYKTEQAALLNQEKAPQTAEEFDRALLATPNDSLLWLQYMTFYLHLTEVDKARAVAERGLKSISFREESEKFNIWIGLLNLENSYGTHESLLKVFQRALQQNEPKNVFKQLVSIYVKSNKFELAEQLYQTMVKRFKSSKNVWTDYAAYLMGRGEMEPARDLLQRSLRSLEKRKHIETITRFAMLEFKHGEPERGRTLFENILTSYPKRTDIWSMYVDVLVKNDDIAAARRLFEREVMLKLSSRKMKFVFKKYLEFEKKHGDENTAENVKKMAEDFVREKAG